MSKIKVIKSCLQGHVKVSGAKNSVLRLMAASLLTDETVTLRNYPSALLDAQVHAGMLDVLGKTTHLVDSETLVIKQVSLTKSVLMWNDRSLRNTLLILGALTVKTGEGCVPLPGGCKLGDRAFDLHEMLLKQLGAEVWQDGDNLCAKAPAGGLVGADIHLALRSTGATENAIICGCLAKGVTRIWNPHIRPEILDLIIFLRSMGAKINIYGQEHIEVTGVEGLKAADYTVMPDNMEAITWLVAAVMTKGDIEIQHFPTRDLEVALIHLRESGAKFYQGEDSLVVRGGVCYPLEISTGPHPSINSDVQPILAAYAACAKGESRIIDLRFPGRYGYAEELAKMKLNYHIDGNMLKIFGNGGILNGSTVRALDLRAGAALTLCGLVAEGETIVEESWQIERGYNNFIEKLISLNGNAEKMK